MFIYDTCRSLSVNNMVREETLAESRLQVSAVEIGHKLLQSPYNNRLVPNKT